MYLKRLRATNFGPISGFDHRLPFHEDVPQPVVVVGPNGSGKSIFLSQIINSLCTFKDLVYPDTREVDEGKVYKLRSPHYISIGADYSYLRVEFENDYCVEELVARRDKKNYSATQLPNCDNEILSAWQRLDPEEHDFFNSGAHSRTSELRTSFTSNCVLFFPHNRMEEPAWLNEDNLQYTSHLPERSSTAGSTTRRIIQYSPLRENQDWLFDVLYDRAVFETRTQNIELPFPGGPPDGVSVPVVVEISGNATSAYSASLELLREVVGDPRARFGIGQRHHRVITVEGQQGQIVS